MKKILTVIILGIVLFGVGFFTGMNAGLRGNLAAIDIVNQSSRSIMTAIVSHEKGSAIAANIKKNKKHRLRIFTKGPNNYSLKITFDNNTTIYSKTSRPIKNGETVKEMVTDSTLTAAMD